MEVDKKKLLALLGLAGGCVLAYYITRTEATPPTTQPPSQQPPSKPPSPPSPPSPPPSPPKGRTRVCYALRVKLEPKDGYPEIIPIHAKVTLDDKKIWEYDTSGNILWYHKCIEVVDGEHEIVLVGSTALPKYLRVAATDLGIDTKEHVAYNGLPFIGLYKIVGRACGDAWAKVRIRFKAENGNITGICLDEIPSTYYHAPRELPKCSS